MTTAANKPFVRILFSILSLFYIAAIFILAESRVVDTLSGFNPYSLLHIPLYGILTFLLIFSMAPITPGFRGASIQPGSDSRGLPSEGKKDLKLRFFIAAGIALVVAIFDEVYQLSVPSRNGSAVDVVLDLAGIAIALLLCFRFFKTRISEQTR
jgi:hypothetical protein